MVNQGLSANQIASLKGLPPARATALRAFYQRQKGNPQGRGNTPAQNRSARIGRRANRNHWINRMPAGNTRHASNPYKAGMSGPQIRDMAWHVTPASSNAMAPRGLGYYDAFENHPSSAFTHMSIGPATPIDAITSVANINTAFGIPADPGSGNDQPLIANKIDPRYAQLLVINPAASRTQAVRFWVETDATTGGFEPTIEGTAGNGSGSYNATALPPGYNSNTATSDFSLQPELKEMIPTRCSVRIRNTSAGLSCGGTIRILRMTTGFSLIPGVTTAKEYWALCDGIREHARTVRYDGKSFTEGGLQKNCTVCDQSRCLWFNDYSILRKYDQNQYPFLPYSANGYSVYNWMLAHAEPAMTPIAILIEPFASQTTSTIGPYWYGNTYDITVRSQFLAHYLQGTMLANMAMNPRADQNLMTRHRNREESFGSNLHKVMGDIIHGAAKLPWKQMIQTAAPAIGWI